MPRFYERQGGGNGYVRGRVDGAFCTWQSTAGGTRKLLERGYSDGDEIDPWFFQHLIDCGDLYTGNSLTERTRGRNRSQASGSTNRRKKSRAQAETEDPLGCVTLVLVIVFILIFFSC